MLADPRVGGARARASPRSGCGCRTCTRSSPTRCRSRTSTSRSPTRWSARRELLFDHVVRADRPALELLTADYTFVNERLARHYGIAGVSGPEFRKVSYPDDKRRGLLGHGSILTLTSHGNRTSPVLRGKWVLEVLLGSPPPPPPTDVPDLDETGEAKDGKFRSVAEQLAHAPREPGVQLVPQRHRSDRPGARQLRRHRRLANQGSRRAREHRRASSTTARRSTAPPICARRSSRARTSSSRTSRRC